MKVLFNWLKEFVPLEGTPSQAAEVLERLGFEVASVQEFGRSITNVVTAEVREVGKHPNADRLSLCKVWDGQQEFSVVCGALNVGAGQRVALARLGAKLPGDFEIKAAKIRGVDSQGMICSASELGLEEKKSDGILILDASTAPGQDIRPLLGLDETLLELEITPNRRDALSVLGIARELAAGLGLSLKNPEPRARELDMSNPITVINEAQDLCPRYSARLIRDIRVGSAPAWMSQRLSRCGIRSINNVVDVTNYVLLELGQPLHAFDAAKMKGRQVRIRRARAGEKLKLLDGREITLQEGMLVIADEARPAALAGIMGGEESAVQESTQEIILESAAFAPTHIRLNSKTLNASSESSYRFERGSDWNMVALASRRAAQLIQDLASGVGFKPVEASALAPAPVTIKMRTDRIKTFLGIEMKDSLAADYLRRLGCEISMGTSQLAATVPSWRLDLSMEADLMEEIARLHGYDQIPQRTPAFKPTAIPEDPAWVFERRLAARFSGAGFLEACNPSFLSVAQAAGFIPGFGQPASARAIEIANPLSQDQALLRPSLLPALLLNALLNFNRQLPGVRLFEIGRAFHEDSGVRHEQRRAALLIGGEAVQPQWRQKGRPADFYDLSGLLESLALSFHLPNLQVTAFTQPVFHPKRSAVLWTGTVPLAWFGEIHPDILQRLGSPKPIIAAELDLDSWCLLSSSPITYAPKSVFPPVRRDISLVADAATPYEQIVRTLRAGASGLLESFSLIDLFQGDKIEAGKKSMTFSLVFRHAEKTLSEADVEKLMTRLITDLQIKCGATLRK